MGSAVASANEFNLKLLRVYRNTLQEGNVFYSSASITIALAMAYTGARQNTKKEMESVLSISDDHSIHEGFHGLFNKICESSVETIVNIVNMLAVDEHYKILQEYSENLQSNYNAAVKLFDFGTQSKKAEEELNQLIEEATHEKIKNFFSDVIDSETRLVLANAIYFKGMWSTQFDKNNTSKKPFYTIKKEEVSVDMMFRKGSYNSAHSADLNASLLELPYLGGKLSMIIILPEGKDGLPFTESNMSLDNLNSAIHSMYKQNDVLLSVPRFKLEESLPLKNCLIDLGMVDAFTPKADFSGVSGSKDLYISAALHKAFVEVNEEGTEAAAVTGLVKRAKCYSPPFYFTVDHPFIFLIREISTGLILFTGSVHTL